VGGNELTGDDPVEYKGSMLLIQREVIQTVALSLAELDVPTGGNRASLLKLLLMDFKALQPLRCCRHRSTQHVPFVSALCAGAECPHGCGTGNAILTFTAPPVERCAIQDRMHRQHTFEA
jgi:hypothetical protein